MDSVKPRLVFKSRDLEDGVDVYVSGVQEAGVAGAAPEAEMTKS